MIKSIMACVTVGFATTYTCYSAYANQRFELRIVSSRPETVSGGDALVQINAPRGYVWSVRLNGQNVTQSFRPNDSSNDWIAFLTGLKPGNNWLEILSDRTIESQLRIVNYPITGPIFSGPHQDPFICQTEANGLGPALDGNCTAQTVVQYYYKSTETPLRTISTGLSPGFKPYNPLGLQPVDVAQTVTSEGRTVNYIVRREIGSVNRAVYDIQTLYQPDQPLPNPWIRPTSGWNGRLVYMFGGGCAAGYRQGRLSDQVGAEQEPFLTLGYAVATSTLNVLENNCNDRLSAETLSMVKEHFIENYGRPIHTIGLGGSGGAIQVYLIAQNFPGLLDGIVAFASSPDHTTWFQIVADCQLLNRAFKSTTQSWAEEQKTAVSGFATWRRCLPYLRRSILDSRNCDASIPKEMIYDRSLNPNGVRCDVYENEINFFGRNPRTGFAYRPLDNIGVQYGLHAFNSGKIDADKFIELNERIGGHDDDGNMTVARTQADPEALHLAYRRGLLLTGRGLNQVPIIDWRTYTDDQGHHDRLQSLVTRARLIAANGNADNQVILVDPPGMQREGELVRYMDRWLDNIAIDTEDRSMAEKVAYSKPAELSEGCWQVDGKRVFEPISYDETSRCNQIYPIYANPRLISGAPLTNDVLKCALKPIKSTDYTQPLSPRQLEQLKAIFPAGVCDYTRAGVGQLHSGVE